MFSNFVYDKRSRPGGFCKRVALKIFLKYIAKIPAIESCSVILLKKGLHWKCFPMNFANNFRSSYFVESKGEHSENTAEAFPEPCQAAILKYLNNKQVDMKLNGKPL